MIKVADITFGRLQSPDLDRAEEFLTDFGMARAERTKDTLYMRGTDPDPFIHVTHLGEEKFIGLAFRANSEEDLARASKIEGHRLSRKWMNQAGESVFAFLTHMATRLKVYGAVT